MVPLIRLSMSLLTKEGARLTANMSRRVARIESAGNTTAAAERFRELQALPAPKTRNEALKRAAELRKLDASKGTRFATAEREARLEQARSQRAATREALVRNPRSLPDAKKVDDLYSNLKKSVSAQVKRVKADPKLGSTQATDKFDKWLADQSAGMSRRQKAAQTRRLIDISEYQGINVRGARIQQQRGVDAFGTDYETWTKDQRAAAWDGFRDLADRSSTSLKSDQVLADVMAATREGSLSVSFYNKTVTDGAGGQKQVLSAAVAPSLTQAQHEATQQEYTSKRLAELIRMSAPRARLI